jgi:acyl-CoA synthetase (AMP-forming)/AMP-acid ligase II
MSSSDSTLLHELLSRGSSMRPESIGLIHGGCGLSYGQLHTRTENFAAALLELDLHRGERVGIYLEKRFETVIASFGAPAAGGVFVPMNPLLKPEQVGFIAQDCGVRVLVTSPDRYLQLKDTLQDCPELRHVVLTERPPSTRARWTGTSCWPRRRTGELRRVTASSTPTSPPSSTPAAAPVGPRAWCCRTAIWWPAPRAWPATWATMPATPCWRHCRSVLTPASASSPPPFTSARASCC